MHREGYKYEEFWRLENAYDDFKDHPSANNILPCAEYPMRVRPDKFLQSTTQKQTVLLRGRILPSGSVKSPTQKAPQRVLFVLVRTEIAGIE